MKNMTDNTRNGPADSALRATSDDYADPYEPYATRDLCATLLEIQEDSNITDYDGIFFSDEDCNVYFIHELYGLETLFRLRVSDIHDILTIHDTLVALGISNDHSKNTDHIRFYIAVDCVGRELLKDLIGCVGVINTDLLGFLKVLLKHKSSSDINAIRIRNENDVTYDLNDLYNPFVLSYLGVEDTSTVYAIYETLVAFGNQTATSKRKRKSISKKNDEPKEREVYICESFRMRYTVSVSSSSTRYAEKAGYYYNCRFYFYSPELKKQIGKDWRKLYALTKKELMRSEQKPTAKAPKKALIQEALANLFRKNAGMSVSLKKKLRSSIDKEIQLNTDELAVFWLTRFNDIVDPEADKSKRNEYHKAFAKLCTTIGNYRLDVLCTANTEILDAQCEELAFSIKRALNAEKSTSNTAEKTKMIRLAISKYLSEHKVDPKSVNEILMKMSIPRKTVLQKIADNMRPKSLSLDRYSEILHELTSKDTGITKGLLLMLFLGLTKEEVCGLNKGDCRNLTCYHNTFQLCIAREYRKNEKKYELVYDELDEFCRCVPIPHPLCEMLPKTIEQGQEDEPLLTEKGKRIQPDKLDDALDALLSTKKDMVTVFIDGRQAELDIAFRASSYRASCRHFWHYYSGLTEGEICYLLARSAPDTLSKHYIDFSNETEQFRMNKQLEKSISLLSKQE